MLKSVYVRALECFKVYYHEYDHFTVEELETNDKLRRFILADYLKRICNYDGYGLGVTMRTAVELACCVDMGIIDYERLELEPIKVEDENILTRAKHLKRLSKGYTELKAMMYKWLELKGANEIAFQEGLYGTEINVYSSDLKIAVDCRESNVQRLFYGFAEESEGKFPVNEWYLVSYKTSGKNKKGNYWLHKFTLTDKGREFFREEFEWISISGEIADNFIKSETGELFKNISEIVNIYDPKEPYISRKEKEKKHKEVMKRVSEVMQNFKL